MIRTIKNDVRIDQISGLKYNWVSINQALKIADRVCGFTMLDARGAIKVFLNNLESEDIGIFMPKGMSLGIWLENLKHCYLQKIKAHRTIEVIEEYKQIKINNL